ncbi:hypothetical protein SAMN04489835_0306 [Mycolicibacterium rutilum]|uniref:Uncharacterized protein n=1 Tax=Mycolicibacterium rutilum TaxID=370526 RepID=A0A1H6IGP2_MYCRU|nr:hypothetical protein [Mycolicibacterium rutilum]SEH48087.1 hypothetical protein SAMN04489835_0306 [Mycolicibacterium rutilum]
MPDFTGLGRGLAKRAKDAGQQAASRVAQEIDAHRADTADPHDTDETASSADVHAEAGRLQAFIASRRPYPGPVQGEWSIGIGGLLAEHPRVPSQMHGLVRKLDRYGGLAISDRGLSVDGDHIEWSSVTEIRTRNIVDYLLADGVVQALDALPLPRFPGRKRVLDALSKAVFTLLLAAAKEQFDRGAEILIPAEIEYRGGLNRRRQLAPGILAALVLADPAVAQCLQATAHAHGTAIVPADDGAMQTAQQRAELLRSKIGALNARFR